MTKNITWKKLTTNSMAILLASMVTVSCDISDNDDNDSETSAEYTFPSDFLWGTATAAHQVESDNINNDWYKWEELGRIKDSESNLTGPDNWNEFANDFDLAVALNTNSYRMSIEWSKIEPTQDNYDTDAIARYHEILDALAARGIKPFVTVQHFTLPTWIHDPTPDAANGNSPTLPGWNDTAETPLIVEELVEFTADMAKEFGSKVDWWITINEPLVMYANGYLVGDFPPGIGYKNEITADFPLGYHPSVTPLHEGDINFGLLTGIEASKVIFPNIIRAHVRMYDAIKENDTVDVDGDGENSWVSISKHHIVFRQFNETDEAAAGLAQMQYMWNEMIWEGIINGALDNDLNGTVDEDLTETMGTFPKVDYIGFNFYARRDVVPTGLAALALGLDPSAFGFFEGFPIDTSVTQPLNPDLGASADAANNWNCLGWEIYPTGMKQIIEFYTDKYPGIPQVVTENGTDNDASRPGWVVDMIDQMGEAMAEGHNVKGYLHWSLMDNFEWERGYGQHFGLVRVEFDNVNKATNRSITEGGQVFADIIANGGVTAGMREQYGTVGNPDNIKDNTAACSDQGAE